MTAGRPAIRVNQLGYLPSGPKQATHVTDARDPAPFEVHAPDRTVVLRGTSVPWPQRPEPSSGQSLHVLDLSAVTTVGDGFRIIAGADRSHPFRIGAGLYRDVARDALGLFRLLRSRHAADVAVPAWTGPDSDRLYPGWERPSGTFDVSGGWYDAGDYGKYTVSGGIALWQLLHLARRTGVALGECRWQLDWMLRMQVPPGQPLAGMAFHRVHGTEWSPIPGRPEDDPTTRVLHRPSTAATLHLAAVASLAARVFQEHDPAYAESLRTAARTAHRAARAHPRLIAPDDEGRFGGGPYGDPHLADDLAWASGGDLETPGLNGFDFDDVTLPALIDRATAGGDATPLLQVASRLVELREGQPYGQPYNPGDWAWGSNGRILNNLVVLAVAHELTGNASYRDALIGGVDYLFGRNALGQCYVTGYGIDTTAHLRTRQFAGALPPGAVAGGANSTETPGFPSDARIAGLPPQQCYVDVDTSETTNDICIRWNAPLAYVTTYLDRLGG